MIETMTAPDRPPLPGAFVAQDERGVPVWVVEAPSVMQGLAPAGRRFHSAALGRQVILVRPVAGAAPAVQWAGQELPPEVQVLRMRVAMFLGLAPSAVIARDHAWENLRPGAWSLSVEPGPEDWPWLFSEVHHETPSGWLVEPINGVTLALYPPEPRGIS